MSDQQEMMATVHEAVPPLDASATPGAPKPEEPSAFRRIPLWLSLFFFLHAGVVIKNLLPIQDEVPRIQFSGLFSAVLSLVIAIALWRARYRLFQFGILLFSGYAYWFLGERLKFLEMMLEPTGIERTLRYSLIGVALILLLPPVFKIFAKPATAYQRSGLLWSKNGVPF